MPDTRPVEYPVSKPVRCQFTPLPQVLTGDAGLVGDVRGSGRCSQTVNEPPPSRRVRSNTYGTRERLAGGDELTAGSSRQIAEQDPVRLVNVSSRYGHRARQGAGSRPKSAAGGRAYAQRPGARGVVDGDGDGQVCVTGIVRGGECEGENPCNRGGSG